MAIYDPRHPLTSGGAAHEVSEHTFQNPAYFVRGSFTRRGGEGRDIAGLKAYEE